MKVGIQGTIGSNHYKVARELYGEGVACVECSSFSALAEGLVQGTFDEAVMAIENSIAGAILPNYNLIYSNGFQILSECYLSISHNLMALKGQGLENIKRVESHPMALLQCATYFEDKSFTLVEADDTASVARRIADEHLEGIAAIAPVEAAALFGLDILAHDIQTLTSNATRFVRLSRSSDAQEASSGCLNKASLRFVTGHKRGSLATILNVMSDCNLNLTKIQSLPIIETPWKYAFFIDVTFEELSAFEKAAAALNIMADSFTVLGLYTNQLKTTEL